MKKLILHVGAGKAGSTSIQKALFDFSLNKDINFTYPQIRNKIGNQIIKYGFCNPDEIPKRFYIDGKINSLNFQEEIKLILENECLGFDNVVISSEFLFTATEATAIKISDFFSRLGFTEIHVLMYLRDPVKYYMSYTQQTIKNEFHIPQPTEFNYKPISSINTWSKINPKSLTVREFNADLINGSDVVVDFENYLNDLGLKAKLISRRLNSSPSSELIQVLQDYQLSTLFGENDCKKINSKKIQIKKIFSELSLERGSQPLIKIGIGKFIYYRYREEILQINSKFGIFGELSYMYKSRSMDVFDAISPSIYFFKDLCEKFDDDFYFEMRKRFHKLIIKS